MTDEPSVPPMEDIEWLVGDQAGEMLQWLGSIPDSPGELVSLTGRLRRVVSAERTHLLLEQVELRRRGTSKFPRADRMFFTPIGLQQSTDAITAAYKARRLAKMLGDVGDRPVYDLCCGVGGDLLALADVFPQVVGVEIDPRMARLVQASARACGFSGEQVRVIEADATTLDLDEADVWHIDPDRRSQGRRTTRVELHRPDKGEVDALRAKAPTGVIKLAPAADVPADWARDGQLEWIGRARQCRQLVVWCGRSAEAPGRRTATVLSDKTGEPAGQLLGDAGRPTTPLRDVGRFIVDPDATVMAADLLGALAGRHNLAPVDYHSGYLTTDEPIQPDAMLQRFEVTDVMPLDRKRLKKLLHERGIGTLEIKKRGVADDIEDLRAKLQLKGDESAVLLLTPVAGHPTAVLARRVVE